MADKKVKVVEVKAKGKGYRPLAPGQDDRIIEEDTIFLCPENELSWFWMERTDGKPIPKPAITVSSVGAGAPAQDVSALTARIVHLESLLAQVLDVQESKSEGKSEKSAADEKEEKSKKEE